MRASTDRVHSALTGDDPTEQLVASRLLQNPTTFRAWESEHSGLMRQVATQSRRRNQTVALRKTAIRLIHGKALFEYLRDGRIRGGMRQRIIETIHPGSDYTRSVISEHGLYLRKACSFLCTSHVGGHVAHDPGFLDPMQRYQELYAEYFQLFCNTHYGSNCEAAELRRSLLPLLKHQLEECRVAIMNPQRARAWIVRHAGLRQRTGDTVPRLPALQRMV